MFRNSPLWSIRARLNGCWKWCTLVMTTEVRKLILLLLSLSRSVNSRFSNIPVYAVNWIAHCQYKSGCSTLLSGLPRRAQQTETRYQGTINWLTSVFTMDKSRMVTTVYGTSRLAIYLALLTSSQNIQVPGSFCHTRLLSRQLYGIYWLLARTFEGNGLDLYGWSINSCIVL